MPNFLTTGFKGNPEYLAAAMYGFTYITDTNVHAGPYGAIFALENSVIESCDSDNGDGTDMTAMDLGDGKTILGLFRNLKLSGGRVWAYKFGV